MTIERIANDFTAAVIADDGPAYQAFWAEDIIGLEPGQGETARSEGSDALLAKHGWWEANAEVHSVTIDGPSIFGNQFAAIQVIR